MKRKTAFFLVAVLVAALMVSCSTGTIVYGDPEASDTALIFYPGGKVDPYAYEKLCTELSEQGIPVIVAKMPMELAVLDINAAKDIVASYPDVKRWFIGGHSLGGAMAATWAAKNQDSLCGVVLLAAYPTKELDIPCLSVYGSEDGVLNREKYAKALSLMSNLREFVIQGGNHCQFGDYGFQKGDNEATIGYDEQIDTTVSLIVDFVSGR